MCETADRGSVNIQSLKEQRGLSEWAVLWGCRAHQSRPRLSKDGWVHFTKGAHWGESKGRKNSELYNPTDTDQGAKKGKKGSCHWPVSANSYRAILLSVLFRIKKQLLSESAFTCQALPSSVTSGAGRSLSQYIPYWNIMSNCWLLEGICIRNLGIEPCFSNVLFLHWWLCPIVLSSVPEKYSQLWTKK